MSGQDWDDALEEQILANDHMIIVLSSTSVESDNVKNEMRYALDHGKHIHPIYIEECSVPLSMRRMHYVDFLNLGYAEGCRRLINDIRKNHDIKPLETSEVKIEDPKKKKKAPLRHYFGSAG